MIDHRHITHAGTSDEEPPDRAATDTPSHRLKRSPETARQRHGSVLGRPTRLRATPEGDHMALWPTHRRRSRARKSLAIRRARRRARDPHAEGQHTR